MLNTNCGSFTYLSKEKIKKEVGERIKIRRKELGMPQRDFAEQIGISAQQMSNIECGIYACRTDHLYSIRQVLRISIEYLLVGERVSIEENLDRYTELILEKLYRASTFDKERILQMIDVLLQEDIFILNTNCGNLKYFSDENIKEMGERIKIRRKELGIAQTDLAEQIGISAQQLSNIECGIYACKVNHLYSISQVLRITIDYLLTGEIVSIEENFDRYTKLILEKTYRASTLDKERILQIIDILLRKNTESL